MLKEIKDFRISEQEKQKLADNLEKVPFHDFTNYKELPSNSEQKIQNNQIDTIDHLSALKDPIDQTEEHPLQVPSFFLRPEDKILQIQATQNEIISSWHKNYKLWEIFKSNKSIFTFYVKLLTARIVKSHIFHKTLKNLEKKYFQPSKGRVK